MEIQWEHLRSLEFIVLQVWSHLTETGETVLFVGPSIVYQKPIQLTLIQGHNVEEIRITH